MKQNEQRLKDHVEFLKAIREIATFREEKVYKALLQTTFPAEEIERKWKDFREKIPSELLGIKRIVSTADDSAMSGIGDTLQLL